MSKTNNTIISKIIEIFDGRELKYSLSDNSYIEISHVLCNFPKKTLVDDETSYLINLSNDISDEQIKHTKLLSSMRCREETLNGISRVMKFDDETKHSTKTILHYDETCYTLIDKCYLWIISIRTPCSPDLIPTIIDYDIVSEYNEKIFLVPNEKDNIFMREIKSNESDCCYDIYTTLEIGRSLSDKHIESIQKAIKKIYNLVPN